MNKKTTRIFNTIAITSIASRLLASILFPIGGSTSLFLLLDVIGQISFLSLLFFVANDLKVNYKKDVWPIYLFACASMFTSFIAIRGATQNTNQFMAFCVGITGVIFSIFLIRTVYRLFGIIFLSVAIVVGILPALAALYLPADQLTWLRFLSYLPIFYPAVLMYIVRKKNSKAEEEINSIGLEVM